MCNCNQKRTMYSNGGYQSKKGMVKVILKENTPVTINGNITGRMYLFSKKNDANWVDERDVMEMRNIKELQILY